MKVLGFKSADPDYFISHVDVTRINENRQEAAKLDGDASIGQAAGKVSGSDGAAALLGMKPTTLYSRILALGLRAKASANTNSRVA